MLFTMEKIPDKAKTIASAKKNIDSAIEQVEAILSVNEGRGIAHYGAFILCSCILDYLAGYCFMGIEHHQSERYKRFIREYLQKVDPRYDDVGLYNHLRCGLVHGYTEMYKHKSKYLFTHLQIGEAHLKPFSDSKDITCEFKTLLGIHAFFRDIKQAGRLFFDEAERSSVSSEIIKSMAQRVEEVGVISGNVPIEISLADMQGKKGSPPVSE